MNSAIRLSFKVIFAEFVLTSPVNSTRDPQKKAKCRGNSVLSAIQTYAKIGIMFTFNLVRNLIKLSRK